MFEAPTISLVLAVDGSIAVPRSTQFSQPLSRSCHPSRGVSTKTYAVMLSMGLGILIANRTSLFGNIMDEW